MITIPDAGIRDFLARRPAPALGPSFTLGSGIGAAFASTIGKSATPDWYQLLLDSKASTDVLQKFIDQRAVPPHVAVWGSTSWPAVLSLTLDSKFDALLRSHQDQHPSRNPVAAIENLADRTPDRKLPIFRLLGTLGRPTAAISRAVYLQRRPSWPFALQAFAGVTRGGPVLLLGFEDAPSLLLDLLSGFQALRSCQPQAFCLFASDPLVTANNPILETIEGLGKTILLDVPPETFANRAGKVTTSATSSPPTAPILDLKNLAEYAIVVNDRLNPSSSATEINRLLDLLTSPATPNWEPFAHGLDLHRSANSIVDDLRTIVNTGDFRSQTFVVSGAAATGKTTLLKRAAFDLAKTGRHVLWLRPIYASDASDVIRTIFRSLGGVTKRAVVVMDDPLAFPSLTPADVANAARNAQVAILLLVAVRTTDRHFAPELSISGGLPVAGEYEFPAELDQEEIDLLPAYLAFKLKLAESEDKAKLLLPKVPTADSLGLLHFLLPQTRKHIESSLSDEYFRLGDTAALTPIVQGAYQVSSHLLQHAYRLVAVSSHYRAPLPLEVLVNALNVSFSDWQEAAPTSSPAWGLLYPDQADTSLLVAYRTRNSLVADELRKIINGGTTNRSGEVKCLEELIGACTGTQSLYTEFCVKILVHNPTLELLSFEDGLRLFDLALNSLPIRDRTLLHHKARWIRKKGPEILEAFPVLDDALNTEQHPFRKERDEFIHTTYARTILKAFEQDKISIDAAKTGIMDHLNKASSDSFINLHATHVRAETTLEFLSRLPNNDAVDRANLTNQALAELDRVLGMVQHTTETAELAKTGDVQLLEVAQSKLLDAVDFDADEQWKSFQSQAGYVAVGRKMLEMAKTRSKGTDYNAAWSYVQKAISTVTSDGGVPGAALHEVAARIYYRWRVQRYYTKGSDKIDWPLFHKHVEGAIRGRDIRRSSFLQYLLALSLCHENQWPEANAIFQKLRNADIPGSVLWLPRDYLLTPEGGIRRVQGTVKAGGQHNLYFVSHDIGFDCRADRKGPWPMSETAEIHAHIRFSLGGPLAFREV